MRNLARRVKRLEEQRFDVTGLVPRSEAWYEFYWEKMDRSLAGEDIGMRIPLEAIDELMRQGEIEDAALKAADPEGYEAEQIRQRQEIARDDDWWPR